MAPRVTSYPFQTGVHARPPSHVGVSGGNEHGNVQLVGDGCIQVDALLMGGQ